VSIRIKSTRDSAESGDGKRFLVDRLWPRGVRKDALRIEAWLKDIAPSSRLRQWFRHDPEKWDEFRHRYFWELAARPAAVEEVLRLARHGTVTLLHASRDREHNNAVALKQFLETRLGERAGGARP
jgi:uncharacterized protein YeaO (DUF488 family)